jgi:hypothetical protein
VPSAVWVAVERAAGKPARTLLRGAPWAHSAPARLAMETRPATLVSIALQVPPRWLDRVGLGLTCVALQVPPRWLDYEHCGDEIYISSFGRILAGEKAIRRQVVREARARYWLAACCARVRGGRAGMRMLSWLPCSIASHPGRACDVRPPLPAPASWESPGVDAPPAADGRPRRRQTWGFIPFAFAKLVLGLADPLESKLRALYRLVCLLLLPGLSDHFPVRGAALIGSRHTLPTLLPGLLLLPGLSDPFPVHAALRWQAIGLGLGLPLPGMPVLRAPAFVTQSARCVYQRTAWQAVAR